MHISIIAVFLTILCTSFGQQQAEWKGKTEYEEDVKVIKNPKEPLYGEIKFELEEDLSIGNEDEENFLFYRIRDIEVDNDGNIYILDSGNYRIQKYDKKGCFLLTIGKQGQGPGEFNTPQQIQLDNDSGNVLIMDRARVIKSFDREGNYIDKDIHLGEAVESFFLDSDGCVWGKFSSLGYNAIKKTDADGRMMKTIAEVPYYTHRRQTSSRKEGTTVYTQNLFFAHGYEYDLYISKIDTGTLVYGHSKKYEIVVADTTGRILFKINKNEEGKKMTADDKKRITEQVTRSLERYGTAISDLSLRLPDYMPYFFGLITDCQGRIYVPRNPLVRGKKFLNEYDIFSKDGYYLYRAYISYFPYVIMDGFIYTRTIDEETGEEKVKRYRIKNWDQIKTGIN